MENKEYYIKYLDNQPVSIETAYNSNGENRNRPLTTVAHLVAAYKAAVAPLLDSTPIDELSLHLPENAARSTLSELSEDCFASIDSNDTTLDPGCLLSSLDSLGSNSKGPLIIKSAIVHDLTVGGIKNFVSESIVTYWKVAGAISNSLDVRGVRSRLYQNADKHLGYYESEQSAFFYGECETTLIINVLSCVSTTSTAPLGERIYYNDYIPTESESPQDTQSVITTHFSTFEQTSDEFKYQRIEKLSIFGSTGKAESCHLMSGSHCRKYPSYSQYDKDPNNRLAMSRDLHGWFDGLNTDIPLFYLKVVSISGSVIVEGRYKVVLAVVALNQESADMIFQRLIEGTSATSDPLIMNTSVYVTKPTIFQTCLEWKEKENKKKWADYY
jgi:hypothetical protein